MRIRGAKTELEEAGLETEGMVESTSKLRSEILALTGVDIMDGANSFKSTYKIMDELAAKWQDLTDIQQASVTELIAGKRQGNIVSSLMTNFDTARDALETSLNSSGSAMKEHEKWQQSLEAQINKLKASWQGLSQAFLSSDFLKLVLDKVINLVDGLTTLIDTFGALPTLLTTVAAGFSLFKNGGLFKTLTSDLDGFINKIGVANRSFADLANAFKSGSASGGLKGFFNGLSAMKNSLSSSLTKADIANIQAYNKEIDNCTSAQTAWNRTMLTSSKAAQDLVSSANGGKVALDGMKTATIGTKVALIGAKVAAIAFNAALTMGISLLINWAVSGIQKLINAKKELAEQVDELTSKFKEQSQELQKLKGDYDTTNESSMISKYAKLSKGVDSLGRNVSLTTEEYSEYQSIVNQIADQIPSLVSGYDSQGNALLSVKGNVEQLTEAYEKLIHAQNQEILTQADDIAENFKNESESKNGWFTSTENRKLENDSIQILEDVLENGLTGKELKDKYNNRYNAIEIKNALEDAGIDLGIDNLLDSYYWGDNTVIWEKLAELYKDDPAKIKGIIDNYYGQFDEAITKYKTIAQAKLSEAFDISSEISGLNYDNINEDLQAVAYQIVGSLDKDFFDKLQTDGKTIEQWTTEMLNQLNSIGQDNSTKIEAAFDLQTQFNGGEISYGEYVDGLYDAGLAIEKLVKEGKLDKEIATEIKLSIGLNEHGMVEEYKTLVNRLNNSEEFNIGSQKDITDFVNDLSSEELPVVWDVITKFEKTDVKETIADLKSALKLEMMLQGLTFDLDIEVEATGIEALNTALAESVSASGLSSESITALKGRYADLEAKGYDLSVLFEETSHGIHINRQEFNKLEKAYATDKLGKVDSELTEMKATYDDLGEAIKNTDDPIRKAELYNDRQTLAKRINEAATLATQYEGLTSAYNDWLATEEAGQERDMYENVIKGFETIDDELSRGWIDDSAIEFLELLTGRTDLAGKSGKQLKEIYDGLDSTIKNTGYSIRDFFTVDDDGNSTNTGVYNFLDAIGQLEEEKFGGKDIVKRDKDGNIIGFDFKLAGGDEAIADALGVSKELVQIMVRAADDAGFVVNLDGTYKQLADLQNEARESAEYLKSIGKTDFEFDFNSTNLTNLNQQLNEAHKILDDPDFWNKDGTFNFDADGATEAMQIVSTLQAKIDNLTEEKYGIGLTVEDEQFEEPLENLQEYGRTVATLNQLKLNPKANAEEIKELEGDLEEISKYFANLDEDLKVKLGFESDDNWKEVQKKIESGEVTIPTVLDIQTNMDKNLQTLADLALLNSGLLTENEEETLRKKYNIDVEADEVDTSDVEDKVESAVIDGLGNPILSREANIEIIAETLGIEDVDNLSSKLEGLDDKTIQAIAQAIGQGNVEALDLAIAGMDGNTVQAIAEALGYSDVETLKTAIANMQGNEVDAKVNTEGQASKINTLQNEIDGLQGKEVSIWLKIKKAASSLWSWVTGNKGSTRNDSNGYGGVNGTAHVDGTVGRAFKQGSWGTKGSGTALVGELGRETLVRGGRYYTIGDDGAEFIKYQKGDIIFNHRQTEELFKNGRVTSGGGRGKAFVDGTAFSSGSGGIGRVKTSTKKNKSKTTTKTTTKKNKDTTTTTTTTTTTSGSSGDSSGGVGKVEGSAVGTNDKDKFEETFDWVSIAIQRIEREIDNLDQIVSNVYKSWGKRNAALSKEITKVGNEITLQNNAAQEYLNKANSIEGLSADYITKIQNGTLNLEDFSGENDEKLVEKIKEYQKWYELYLQCIDKAEELKETEAELYKQRFENIQSQYDGILKGFEHTESMLNEYISQAEAKGHIISKKYYQALIDNEKNNITELQKEQSELIAKRDEAVASGAIVKGSEAWYDMCSEIDGVTQAIEESNTAIIEFNNSIRDIDWEVFDLIQERISDVTDEANFLIDLMSYDKLFDDNGKLTDNGVATMGLHAQNYNTYMYQADDYKKEIAELDAQIAKDPYDQELINRRRELVELQRESILAAEDEKQAIKDLVEEGINLELDALQELIDKKNEELESEKDLYEYQKKVKEQTEEIASIEKQMAAYSGDNSEEARAKVQELKVSLEEAKTNLKETEYDKYLSDTQQMLDALYEEYELTLNTRLDDVDGLISQVIEGVNAAAGALGVDGTITSALGADGAIATALSANANTIKTTLENEVKSVGTTLSTAMSDIWNAEGSGNKVITMYGEGFQQQQTTTNTVLNSIKASVDRMVDDVDKDATTKVTANKTTTSAKKDPTKTTTTTTKKPSATNKTGGDGVPKVGDKVKFLSGQYYYDSQGKKPLGSKNHGKQVYITNINKKSWATHPYHISTGKKLGSGDLGWLKLNQLSGYATGKKNFLNNEIAWTQENGKEFIVRPSDGAILTPIAKGDSVLNAQASGNIWDMANSPAEFIKDNLNLGVANTPNNSNVNNSTVQNFEQIVFSMPNVRNYEQLLAEMQRDKNFEKLIMAMTLDQVAGKSSLAKNKSIRKK